ncbi:MAG: hypothetical protein R8L07_07285 [Alphaproteobacteria bacterium]|nr:hypothetical protein [Alphaproteobacteria bacterium]
MPKVQVIHERGSPSAMNWNEWAVPAPAPGDVRMRHTAVGVAFADTCRRGGVLNTDFNYEHALKDAVKAHEAIEGGGTLGATVPIP